MKNNIRVAVDIDGTILDHYAFTNRYIEEELGLHMMHPESYKEHERFGLTKEHFERNFGDKVWDAYGEANPIFPHAIETIKMLYGQLNDNMILATSRDPAQAGKDRLFQIKNGLAAIQLKYCDWINDKVIDLALFHTTHLIDDNPSVAINNASCGITVLLMDAPYNRTVEHENIIRVHDWYEIDTYFADIFKGV